MTAAQTIQLRLSFLRENLNRLLQVETRSAEEQTEMEALTKEVGAKEPELRAALAAEPDPQEVVSHTGDSETRERAELRGKTGLADFLQGGGGRVGGHWRGCGVCDVARCPDRGAFTDGAFRA